MASRVPTLKAIVLEVVCKNFDTIFNKRLHKLRSYLKEQECEDCSEFYIVNQDNNTIQPDHNDTDAAQVLRAFVESKRLPELLWKETMKKKSITVGLEINNVVVEVDGDINKKEKAKTVAAQLMVKKLYSKYLSDPILNNYCKQEMTHKRHQVYESESLFRTTVPACAVNAVDELQEYEFTERERWEMLRNIPEYRLRRSHFMLLLDPKSQQLDFSFCPSLFSSLFLELILKKAKDIKSINLENCYKSVSSDNSIITVLKKCQDTLHFLNISRCEFVNSEKVFRNLRKYDIPLKQLSLALTYKENAKGSIEFQKYFTSSFGRRLLSLNLSGLTLCESELDFILSHCKRLEELILEETQLQANCFCHNHISDSLFFQETVVTKLKELNVRRSPCKDKILRVIVDNNKGLERLYIASMDLTVYLDPVELKQLESLSSLDISFQGSGAYEDFAVFKQDFARSLVWLNVSGYCDVDISRLSVTCPHLNTLILNFSIIDLSMACSSQEDSLGRFVSIPHAIQNLHHLVKLELRYTIVNLLQLMESSVTLPLEELVVEGNMLDNDSLIYIVNAQVTSKTEPGRMVHVFSSLRKFHICNCNNVTDLGVEQANFPGLPALKDLVIERCSGIRLFTLSRLQQMLKRTSVSLTCFVRDERPKFHAMKEIEIVMG